VFVGGCDCCCWNLRDLKFFMPMLESSWDMYETSFDVSTHDEPKLAVSENMSSSLSEKSSIIKLLLLLLLWVDVEVKKSCNGRLGVLHMSY
jgi:hypothetical protein